MPTDVVSVLNREHSASGLKYAACHGKSQNGVALKQVQPQGHHQRLRPKVGYALQGGVPDFKTRTSRRQQVVIEAQPRCPARPRGAAPGPAQQDDR